MVLKFRYINYVTVVLDKTVKKILSINISCGVYNQSKLPLKNASTPVIPPLPSLWPSTVHTGLSAVQHHLQFITIKSVSLSVIDVWNLILDYLETGGFILS